MSAVTTPPATLDDLMRTEGKAELIAGRVVRIMPSGLLPGLVAGRIARRLDDYADARGAYVTGPYVGFVVRELPSGRQSFCPDVGYTAGPLPANPMDFVPCAPLLAVEVRSKSDTGPKANREYAAKRGDYFAAGTLVVWDVDPVARTVDCTRASDPLTAVRFADVAEPALPGWRVPVADLFPPALVG